jgi:hypothetical protein
MTRRPKRLARLNRLSEDRAELAMQAAKRDEIEARGALAEAQRVQAAVDAGKHPAGTATLDVGRYAHALALDELAGECIAVAEQQLDARRGGTEAARAEFERANRRARASESRDARAQQRLVDAEERRGFDEMLDLWVANRAPRP